MPSQREIDELKSEKVSFFCEMATIFGTGKPRKGESHNEFWIRRIGDALCAEEDRYNVLKDMNESLANTAADSHGAGVENRRRLRQIRVKVNKMGLLAERGLGITGHGEYCEYGTPFSDPVPKGETCKCAVGMFQEIEGLVKEIEVLALHENDRDE